MLTSRFSKKTSTKYSKEYYMKLAECVDDEICTSCGTNVARKDVTDDHYDSDDQFYCTACWEKDNALNLWECACCHTAQIKSHFSKSQLKKSLSVRKCIQCVRRPAAATALPESKLRVKLPKNLCAATDQDVSLRIQLSSGPVVYAVVDVSDLHRSVLGTHEVSTDAETSTAVYMSLNSTSDPSLYLYSGLAPDPHKSCEDVEAKVSDDDTTHEATTTGSCDAESKQTSEPTYKNVAKRNNFVKASDATKKEAVAKDNDAMKVVRWQLKHAKAQLKHVQEQLRGARTQANIKQTEHRQQKSQLEKNLRQVRKHLALQKEKCTHLQKKVTRKTLAEAQESSECLVCMDAHVTTAFIPCGHCLCCDKCAQRIRSSNNKCPFCRRDITSVLRVRF